MTPFMTPPTSPVVVEQKQEAAPRRGGLVRFLFWIAGTLPTLLVLGLLGSVAYWGHATGWKLPKASALWEEATATADDWCPEHNVLESVCVECRPDLLPRGKEFGWCKTHGVRECPLEHPEVAQAVPTPILTEADLLRAKQALAFAERAENDSKCKLYLRRLQFASAEAVEKLGIDVAPVWRSPMTEAVSANGEITYDQTRVARLSARVAGIVWRVEKKVGDAVSEGEVLALIDAAEVGRAKSEFLQARAQVTLKSWSNESAQRAGRSGSISELQLREAEAALSEARIRLLAARQALTNLDLPVPADEWQGLREEEIAARLQFLGLPKALVDRLDPARTTSNLIPVRAPLAGVVVSREVVAGEVVDTSKPLFIVADVRQMWLTLNLRLEDARLVRVGQPVSFRPDGGKEETAGQVAWISTAVDEKTRTVQVRADLPNPEGRLRAHTFGSGRVVLREERDAIVVPNEAVHWEGGCHVVFVRDKRFLDRDAPKVFYVRQVRPGARNERYTEIIAGVLPNEVVAAKGSGVMRSELLKNDLGAG